MEVWETKVDRGGKSTDMMRGNGGNNGEIRQ
jgi:hypothetical protein